MGSREKRARPVFSPEMRSISGEAGQALGLRVAHAPDH